MTLFDLLAAAPTPTPSPTLPGLNVEEDAVTPGWIGFAITFLIAVVTVLLVLDMTRRLRKVRYRGEIREQLEAERAAEEKPDQG